MWLEHCWYKWWKQMSLKLYSNNHVCDINLLTAPENLSSFESQMCNVGNSIFHKAPSSGQHFNSKCELDRCTFLVYWPLKALYITTQHSQIHTHTFICWWQRLPCKVPTCSSGVSNHSHTYGKASGSNLGFSILPKDTLTCWLEEPGSNPLISGRPAFPPEPQLPHFHVCSTLFLTK